MILSLILGIAVLAIFLFYFCIESMYYWRKRGVKQQVVFNSFRNNWFSSEKESTVEISIRYYNQFPGTRYFGIYQSLQPALVIKDLELLKQITVKDFDHFMDHKNLVPQDIDPLWGKNLVSLTGQKWRDMRPILSPSFTSSKMRSMFVLMSKCSDDFVNFFLKRNEDCIEMEMKDTFTRFGSDVIATTAFGVKVDSLEEPNNEFYLMGKEVTDFRGFWKGLKIIGFSTIPKVLHFLGVPFISREVSQFFEGLVNETIKTREENRIVRPDMLHLLMEAKKGIHHKEESIDVDTGYATVKEANIESLRKWPSGIVGDRVCTKPFTIESTNPDEKPLYIEKNTVVIIPIAGIHRDPKYYPNPTRFDPERFSDENKGNINPLAYLPFGLGPRNCIGSRFALLEVKIIFFHILSHFELVPVKKTPIPLKIAKNSFNLGAEGGFWLGLKRLSK